MDGLINVDISSLGNNLSAQVGYNVANAVTVSIQNSLALIKDEWQRRIQNTLHSTVPLYLMGLDFNSVVYPYGGDVFSGAVVLREKFPNMLESGFPAFDEKIGFGKSSRKHTSKDGKGWYLTIPMRHSTPGAYMYGQPMPPEIYKEAKKLSNTERLSIQGGQQTSWTGYVHKSNIYDGLTRIIKSYHNPNTGKVTKQSQYMTFRRVSNNSDPLSWWHPGYSGVHMVQQLEPYAMQIFKNEINKNLAKVLT